MTESVQVMIEGVLSGIDGSDDEREIRLSESGCMRSWAAQETANERAMREGSHARHYRHCAKYIYLSMLQKMYKQRMQCVLLNRVCICLVRFLHCDVNFRLDVYNAFSYPYKGVGQS